MTKIPLPGTEPVAPRDPGSALPAQWHRGTFMQVFVRSYQDSNGDGVGDLAGLTSRLDHLHELGVQGLWLMPIHPSQDGDHGYAVTDYRGIDPAYGTLDDFDELLRQAHARGMGVILDYVINHSAAAHPLFQASRLGRDSPYRDWYVWLDEHPPGWRIYDHDPWRRDGDASYFAAFSRHMPDFNWRHPAVEAWHHDNLRFWLNRGVDGFRFDAVGHLVENGPDAWDCQPENHAIMARVRSLLDGYAHRFMVCEAPGDPQGFARAAGSAFAFDLNGQLLAFAQGDAQATVKVAKYFESASPTVSTLLSNHDSFAGHRVMDQLHGRTACARVAAAANLLSPGTPFVYYGEEIGMAGHPGLESDPGLRTPMSWTSDPQHAGFSTRRPYRALSPNATTHHVAGQRGAPDSLLSFYQRLIHLRRGRPSLHSGAYRLLAAQGLVWAFLREWQAAGVIETTLVVLHAGTAPATLTLSLDASLQWLEGHAQPHMLPQAQSQGQSQGQSKGQPTRHAYTLQLPAHAVAVYHLA